MLQVVVVVVIFSSSWVLTSVKTLEEEETIFPEAEGMISLKAEEMISPEVEEMIFPMAEETISVKAEEMISPAVAEEEESCLLHLAEAVVIQIPPEEEES